MGFLYGVVSYKGSQIMKKVCENDDWFQKSWAVILFSGRNKIVGLVIQQGITFFVTLKYVICKMENAYLFIFLMRGKGKACIPKNGLK